MSQNIRRASLLTLIPYVVAIGIAEGVLSQHFIISVALNTAVILFAIIHYSLWPIPSNRPLSVLALLSLLRLISLSIPQPDIDPIFWLAMIGLSMLICTLIAMWVLGFSPRDIGLSVSAWKWQVPIALLGVPLAAAAMVVIDNTVLPEPKNSLFTVLYVFVLAIFSALAEELLFRGLLQSVLAELFGRGSILLTTLLFALMYVSTGSATYVGFVAVVGLLFSWLVWRTNSIWGVVAAHTLINIGVFLIAN